MAFRQRTGRGVGDDRGAGQGRGDGLEAGQGAGREGTGVIGG
jgi:hypothetical protein